MPMNTRPALATASLLLLSGAILTGCAGTTPTPEPDEPLPPGDVVEDDCVVGTWNLDVGAYESDSLSFLLNTGVPVESYAMDGAGKLTFTDDGLVSAEIGLTTDATVRGFPLSVPSSYVATGDWSRTGDDTLQFDNWGVVRDEPDIPPEEELPGLDLTQLAGVTVGCSADALFLQGAEAPFGATWTR